MLLVPTTSTTTTTTKIPDGSLCALDSSCGPNSYCSATFTCTSKQYVGTTCTRDVNCLSGHCTYYWTSLPKCTSTRMRNLEESKPIPLFSSIIIAKSEHALFTWR